VVFGLLSNRKHLGPTEGAKESPCELWGCLMAEVLSGPFPGGHRLYGGEHECGVTHELCRQATDRWPARICWSGSPESLQGQLFFGLTLLQHRACEACLP